MLRVALILTPLALVTAIACGDSDTESDGSFGPIAGSTSAEGGEADQAGTGNAPSTGTGGSSSNNGGTTTTTPGGAPDQSGGAATEMSGGAAMTDTGGADMGAAGADVGSGAGGADGAGGAAACPDLFGSYTVRTAAGMCGDLDKGAPQAIDGDDVTCFAHFVSAPTKGKPAVNGGADIDARGAFKDAKLTLGTAERSPCSGTYNPLTASMTIKCGGAGDLCTLVMTKK